MPDAVARQGPDVAGNGPDGQEHAQSEQGRVTEGQGSTSEPHANGLLPEFVARLRAAGLDPDTEQLCDALWLARWTRRPGAPDGERGRTVPPGRPRLPGSPTNARPRRLPSLRPAAAPPRTLHRTTTARSRRTLGTSAGASPCIPYRCRRPRRGATGTAVRRTGRAVADAGALPPSVLAYPLLWRCLLLSNYSVLYARCSATARLCRPRVTPWTRRRPPNSAHVRAG